jgi:hypothetical protein
VNTQAKVEAYIEQLVRQFLSQGSGFYLNPQLDVPFIMAELNNIPWAVRVFIVTDALIRITTYFPQKP